MERLWRFDSISMQQSMVKPLSGRSLAIDPFSFPNAIVVHYLVNKNDIIKLAEEVDSNSRLEQCTSRIYEED